jgi:type II secretory ATPase GspE/PulE/Tfp pilus assembly ATPase PilB-like protein
VLDHLAEIGKLDQAALARAELVAARTKQPVEQVLNQLGALTDDELAEAYATICGRPVWDPITTPATLDPAELDLSQAFLQSHRILPLERDEEGVLCAVCDPLDDEGVAGLAFATGASIRILVAKAGDWRSAFAALQLSEAAPIAATDEQRLEREIDQVSDLGDEGAGARLVAAVFEAAMVSHASDIHFEPRRNDFRIRLRIDGQLVDHRVVSPDLAAQAVSRVKVIANLNLGERRLPQDGRTTFVVSGRQIDVRVATAPTVFGESAVLRILDRANVPLDLDALGFSAGVARQLRIAAAAPHGLFLITGPTGSGKTTTLYSILQTFAGSRRKILSVEDPVEYHFEHVSQTQVAPGVGLTFATALRAFLRQDPDVIMVGEIRDPETAAVAMQAAMTGHFVLASVHANDAVAVIPRLLDIGVEPYQLAAGLRGAGAQRLVRRLCPTCKVAHAPTTEDLAVLAAHDTPAPEKLFSPAGCPSCAGQGFKGRVAIGEVFLTDGPFLRAIAEAAPDALGDHARRMGLTSMAEDGARKAADGVTTLAEVMAAINA